MLVERVLQFLFPPRAEAVAQLRVGRPGVARGRVVPRDLIDSPLTGERCVYYRHSIEELRPSTPGSMGNGLWICVGADEAIAEFYLDDGTGRVLVLPARAEVVGGAAGRVALPAGQRATETVIAAGAMVEVTGLVEEVDDHLDDSRGYRDEPVRAALCAPEAGVLRIRVIKT